MIEYITSIEDPRLDVYARLTEAQLRNKLESDKAIFIAESGKVIERALAAGMVPVSLLMEEKWLPSMAGMISDAEALYAQAEETDAAGSTLPVFVASRETLEPLIGYELTRGALAAFRRPPLPSVEEVCAGARRIAILEDITNHTNVGAIFRSAAALNLDAVLVTPACYDPWYRRAIRVSMGTVFQIPWTRIGGDAVQPGTWGAEGLPLLHDLGFTTCALALSDDSIWLDDPVLQKAEKLAMVLGTEGDGLSHTTIANCDYTVKIPMGHGVDSLNVAAASAVAFWELRVK